MSNTKTPGQSPEEFDKRKKAHPTEVPIEDYLKRVGLLKDEDEPKPLPGPCTKPDCDCIEQYERKHGKPPKYGYPCLHPGDTSDLKKITDAKAQKVVDTKTTPENKTYRWVKVSDRLPPSRQNCHVMVFTPLQGGYNYKSTRLWDGETWRDELHDWKTRDEVAEWLEEIPTDQEITALRQEVKEYRKMLERIEVVLPPYSYGRITEDVAAILDKYTPKDKEGEA